jgi:hypothetical protein
LHENLAILVTLKCARGKSNTLLVEYANSIHGNIGIDSDGKFRIFAQECIESSVIDGVNIARSCLRNYDVMVIVHVAGVGTALVSLTVGPAVGSACHQGSWEVVAGNHSSISNGT